MFYVPQGRQFQAAELLHEVLKRKAFLRFDLPQYRRWRPVDIEGADGLGLAAAAVQKPTVSRTAFS
jgi:hypothetical protein